VRCLLLVELCLTTLSLGNPKRVQKSYNREKNCLVEITDIKVPSYKPRGYGHSIQYASENTRILIARAQIYTRPPNSDPSEGILHQADQEESALETEDQHCDVRRLLDEEDEEDDVLGEQEEAEPPAFEQEENEPHILQDAPGTSTDFLADVLPPDLNAPTLPSRCLSDALHAMLRINPKAGHSMKPIFLARVRDTMFVPDEDDKARVLDFLSAEAEPLDWNTAMQVRADWVLKRVRRQVPAPAILYESLKKLFKCVRCSHRDID
jgi:hypothetical protein